MVEFRHMVCERIACRKPVPQLGTAPIDKSMMLEGHGRLATWLAPGFRLTSLSHLPGISLSFRLGHASKDH